MQDKCNVLLLGGAGFIGSNIIKRFLEDDKYNIFVMEPAFADLSRIECYEDRITIVRTELKEIEFIHVFLVENSIHTVIHFVSTIIPNCTFDNYQKELKYIMLPTNALLHVCSLLKIKFVYFSSGGTIYGNSSKEICKESTKASPISYYGFTKLQMEESIIFENRRFGLKYLIIRPSNPYGKGQNLNGQQGLIAVALGKILQNNIIRIWGDGSSVRDYIFIDDLAENFYHLINNNIENEIINIGSGVGHSINNVLTILKENISNNIRVEFMDKRVVDVSSVVLDITKLKKYITIENTPLNIGIKKFYEIVNK